MEKLTRAEVRRRDFNRQGKIARELADLALQEIDDALLDYAEADLGSIVIRSESQILEPIKRLDK